MTATEIYRLELTRRLAEAKRAALLSTLRQLRESRPLTLHDLVSCLLDDTLGEIWLEDSDQLEVGALVGDATYCERVVDLLERLVPVDPDPDDALLAEPLTRLSTR